MIKSNQQLVALLGLILGLAFVLALLAPQEARAHYLKKKQIRALKKVAIAATVLGNRKKIVLPLPVPLPLPIPIIHKHEPIISPIDPLLTITAAKAAKGYYPGYAGLHGGGFGYGKRR